MEKDKIQQLLTLITCILVVAAVAMNRDHKLWGNHLTDAAKSGNSAAPAVQPMEELPDGTIVLNTTDLGRDIRGFAGVVPLQIYLKDGKIAQVKALKNAETPDFFSEASALLKAWDGKTVEEASAMKVDAVSGATFSSRAIIGNMQRGLQFASKNAVKPGIWDKLDLSAKSLLGLVVVLMAAIVPLFYKNKRYRLVQLVLNVVVLGFWCGTFLSYSLFVNYLSGGIDVWISLIPIVMLITAFIYPLFGKKNYYCNYICPCGSLQELAGQVRKKKWKISSKTVKRLTDFRKLLWAVLMVLMLIGVGFEWMDYEIFAAFIVSAAGTVVLVLATIFLVLSVFVPRPYCRFVCPTGTLFKIAQNSK